jgi:hypothetical protein
MLNMLREDLKRYHTHFLNQKLKTVLTNGIFKVPYLDIWPSSDEEFIWGTDEEGNLTRTHQRHSIETNRWETRRFQTFPYSWEQFLEILEKETGPLPEGGTGYLSTAQMKG